MFIKHRCLAYVLYFEKIIFYSINENNFEERESRICKCNTRKSILNKWAKVWNAILKKDCALKKCASSRFLLPLSIIVRTKTGRSHHLVSGFFTHYYRQTNKEKAIQGELGGRDEDPRGCLSTGPKRTNYLFS